MVVVVRHGWMSCTPWTTATTGTAVPRLVIDLTQRKLQEFEACGQRGEHDHLLIARDDAAHELEECLQLGRLHTGCGVPGARPHIDLIEVDIRPLEELGWYVLVEHPLAVGRFLLGVICDVYQVGGDTDLAQTQQEHKHVGELGSTRAEVVKRALTALEEEVVDVLLLRCQINEYLVLIERRQLDPSVSIC